MLLPAKTVNIRIENVMQAGQPMQILALLTLWTQTPGEEEAKVRPRLPVCAREARVARDVAASGCGALVVEGVVAVAAGPFVVPYVEDCARLGWGLGFEGRGVDLWACGTALFDDAFYRLFLVWRGWSGGEGGFCGGF